MGRISQRSKRRAEKEFNIYFKSMEKARRIPQKGDRVSTPYGDGEVFESSVYLSYVDVNLDTPIIDAHSGKKKSSVIVSISKIKFI
jgi:hypothetical protein